MPRALLSRAFRSAVPAGLAIAWAAVAFGGAEPALVAAVRQHDVARVESLLAETADVDVAAGDGSTAKVQMSLSRSGQYTMVKILDATPPLGHATQHQRHARAGSELDHRLSVSIVPGVIRQSVFRKRMISASP